MVEATTPADHSAAAKYAELSKSVAEKYQVAMEYVNKAYVRDLVIVEGVG